MILLFLCTALFAQQKDTYTDTRDGKVYKTTKIGEQVWMAENLNYEVDGSKCYNDSTAYCEKYGRLYNWETATKVCPSGWHLPSNDEWETLIDFVGGDEAAGKYLKSKSGWLENSNGEGNGEDKYGFSALPGGSGGGYGYRFIEVGNWWSDSEYNRKDNYGRNNGAFSRSMEGDFEDALSYNADKDYLYSVRCVQDQ
jgi:uncharacterized protein (TIGR02145 family)